MSFILLVIGLVHVLLQLDVGLINSSFYFTYYSHWDCGFIIIFLLSLLLILLSYFVFTFGAMVLLTLFYYLFTLLLFFIIYFRASIKLSFYTLLTSINFLTFLLATLLLCFVMYLFSFRIYSLSIITSLIVLLVSSCVIIYSFDYISLYDYFSFFTYLAFFLVSMIVFVLCNDLLIIFFYWELLGITSYLLINFWSNKNQCGIKAVVYNKVGDCFFLLFILLLSFFNYTLFSYSILLHFILLLVLSNFSITTSTHLTHYHFLLFLFIAISSKSAQLPFSSWLINAMIAPTPVSALLHSSTMVIAGIYLGLKLLITTPYFYYYLSIIPVTTILWSSFNAIASSDIKSIIAYSTVSQISYLFIILVYNPSATIVHIIIHAFFKSLLFLLAAEIIHLSHCQFQSIYLLTHHSNLLRSYYLVAGSALIGSASKESIIHYSLLYYDFNLFSIILIFTLLLTSFYTLLLYFSLFSNHLTFHGLSTLYSLSTLVIAAGRFSSYHSIDAGSRINSILSLNSALLLLFSIIHLWYISYSRPILSYSLYSLLTLSITSLVVDKSFLYYSSFYSNLYLSLLLYFSLFLATTGLFILFESLITPIVWDTLGLNCFRFFSFSLSLLSPNTSPYFLLHLSTSFYSLTIHHIEAISHVESFGQSTSLYLLSTSNSLLLLLIILLLPFSDSSLHYLLYYL